jgi:proteasome assembly chaperone (PAC2) family protein
VPESEELYELERQLPELQRPVLVHTLSGFVDAGAAAEIVRDHLLETLEHERVATFDVDRLLDYRSRRPPMVFVEDHWESYDDPVLALHMLRDQEGNGFLLLEGPEPDVQWERFLQAMRSLVERFDVRLTVGLHSIPMGVPHTRPVGVTAHATRPELIPGNEPWLGTVQVPGSITNLLEFRLGQAGHDAVGYAAHVPHYLAHARYPEAAEALFAKLVGATRLTVPTEALREAAERTRTEIDEQVSASAEVAAVVQALEQQYDAYVGGRNGPNLLANRSFPTADELGAELERFLADQSKGQSGPEGREPS